MVNGRSSRLFITNAYKEANVETRWLFYICLKIKNNILFNSLMLILNIII